MELKPSIFKKGKLLLITILVAIVVILNLFILQKVLKGTDIVSTNEHSTLLTN